MIHRTHRGKIGRLSRKLREELNHRLEDGTPGVLAWLNALPEVQAMLAAQFGGSPINAQNLSNWRQGGYLEWFQQQEHRGLVRELAANAQELGTDAEGSEVGNHLSVVLVAEIAASAREALAGLGEPLERCDRLQELLKTLARVRQQDYLAGRLAIERERRGRERTEEQRVDDLRRQCEEETWPLVQSQRRSDMVDLFAKPDFTSQALGMQAAESLLRSRPDGAIRTSKLNDVAGVAQAFQPASSGDFPVASARNTGHEAEARPAVPVNSQTRMSALHRNRDQGKFKPNSKQFNPIQG